MTTKQQMLYFSKAKTTFVVHLVQHYFKGKQKDVWKTRTWNGIGVGVKTFCMWHKQVSLVLMCEPATLSWQLYDGTTQMQVRSVFRTQFAISGKHLFLSKLHLSSSSCSNLQTGVKLRMQRTEMNLSKQINLFFALAECLVKHMHTGTAIIVYLSLETETYQGEGGTDDSSNSLRT